MLDNATCQIIATVAGVDADDSRQTAHTTETWPEQRCSLRALAVLSAANALGTVSLRGYRCRLQSEKAIQAGWRLRAKRDDEDDWREYAIRQARHSAHWVLILEGV